MRSASTRAAAASTTAAAGHWCTAGLRVGDRKYRDLSHGIFGLALRAHRLLRWGLHVRRKLVKRFAAIFTFEFINWHVYTPVIDQSISSNQYLYISIGSPTGGKQAFGMPENFSVPGRCKTLCHYICAGLHQIKRLWRKPKAAWRANMPSHTAPDTAFHLPLRMDASRRTPKRFMLLLQQIWWHIMMRPSAMGISH